MGNSHQLHDNLLPSVYFDQMYKYNFKKPSSGTVGSTNSPYARTVVKWKQELNADWLDFEVEGDTVVELSCRVCKEYSVHKTSPYVHGTKNVHKASVIFHMKSEAHAVALRIMHDIQSEKEKWCDSDKWMDGELWQKQSVSEWKNEIIV